MFNFSENLPSAGYYEEVGVDRPRREGARQVVPRVDGSCKAREPVPRGFSFLLP